MNNPDKPILIRKLLPYFIQGIAVGIIGGLAVIVLLWLKPFQSQPVVEIRQAASSAGTIPAPTSYADAVDLASDAVVNIQTTKTIHRHTHPFFDDPEIRRYFGGPLLPREQQLTHLGSGVIVSDKGYIATNHHVIKDADEISVVLHDGRSAVARIIGTDPDTDIAILKIQLEQLRSIVFGDSGKLRVGDVVLAIGNPFGVGQTVTQGIVSATGRSQLGLSTFENFIQTDAAINPGNSGGALINSRGELIGINTAIYSRSGGSQGIGFAIPTSLAQDVLTQLIEHGQVTRGWLGIEIQTLSAELAESFGIGATQGTLIAGVQRDGPADQAGLQPGDIVTRINDTEVTRPQDALAQISQFKPGTTIGLHILRNSQDMDLSATVGTRPVSH